jgi:hypothetical protein
MDLLAVVSFENPSRSGAGKARPDNGGEAFGPWGTAKVYPSLSSIYTLCCEFTANGGKVINLNKRHLFF